MHFRAKPAGTLPPEGLASLPQGLFAGQAQVLKLPVIEILQEPALPSFFEFEPELLSLRLVEASRLAKCGTRARQVEPSATLR